jgi:ribosomal protein L7/L12
MELQKTALQNINSSELSLTVTDMIHSGKGETEIIKYVREKTGLGLVEAKNFVDHLKNN